MTTTKTEERASTAKQIARSSQDQHLTMDDLVICYKVLTGIDPETIINDHQDKLLGHPQLQRIHISRTTDMLIRHAVTFANLVEERRDQIIDEDAELVMAFCNGETNFCPDRSELMSVLSQYGVVLRKCAREKTWREMTYGGTDFSKFFDRDELGQAISSEIRRTERDADKSDLVRKIQFVEFSKSPLVFLTWTDNRGVRYIAYAAKDWQKVEPLGFAA